MPRKVNDMAFLADMAKESQALAAKLGGGLPKSDSDAEIPGAIADGGTSAHRDAGEGADALQTVVGSREPSGSARLSFLCPPELKYAFRVRALQEGKSMGAVLRTFMIEYVEGERYA